MPKKILLLGLGEVGTLLAEDLPAHTSAALAAWDIRFPEAQSIPARNLKRYPSLLPAADARSAAKGCDLVISAVTAGQALTAAEAVLDGLAPGSWFLDINSVAPSTKQHLATAAQRRQVRFVEAAVMSPISPRRLASPILLAGPHAGDFLPVGQALGFTAMRLCSPQPGRAAATKMCRSIIVKGLEALITESLLAARHHGVEDAVLDSLKDLFPRDDWRTLAAYMVSRTLQHGTRRAEEMREAARTVKDAGYQPWISTATAERQAWAGRFDPPPQDSDLEMLLDTLAGAAPAPGEEDT